MTQAPQIALLPDKKRLHLQHGPIDLIIEVWGPERTACYAAAIERFESILTGLVSELPLLRRPGGANSRFTDPVARRMAAAVAPFGDAFVTPMAAVAGAVADEILGAMLRGRAVSKAYVNNGGDIAFHIAGAQSFTSLSPAGKIIVTDRDPARGVATSGWRGRSHSLGIADAVTVVADCAAQADVAATLIANAVDIPSHRAIERLPASDLAPDSDLGTRPVTVAVPALSESEKRQALDSGLTAAREFHRRGLIADASLLLQGRCVGLQGVPDTTVTKGLADA
ncbi:UPF0280 family protein [Roseobacter sp. YSTF-M11]|uniref:UPF0280 family protein n=1 Tax=Roseobacter insulae TaxID=2859783 RepID=A0A9X1JXV5_9RHOB|nr:UPF0280 family protein [Roseobacter insulae]MBW4707521.1 UPF0280 family protein [Roseobacter insulae]